MSYEYDLIIRGGTIVDGTGKVGWQGDVAVDNGRIARVGEVPGKGREEIDATGKIVTPGFVDLHTHFDGQVTWENTLMPSSNHGVTTVIMGNCGVGFAPCRPADRDALVKLMEGVEDIPEVVMVEGLPWNWETFSDYLDALDARTLDIDIAAQVPHSALRVYVMGERALNCEPATAEDRKKMREIVANSVREGAWGVSTSRMLFHRDTNGDPIPSLGSTVEELKELAAGLKDANSGVFQLIANFQNAPDKEFGVMEEIVTTSGRPFSFSLAQNHTFKDAWRDYLKLMKVAHAKGLDIRGQIAPRPNGMLVGLDLSFNPLTRRPSWKEIASLPLDQKVARLKDPEFRAKILSEQDSVHPLPLVENVLNQIRWMTVIEDVPSYFPKQEDLLGWQADQAGMDVVEYALDRMLERGGSRVIYLAAANYADHKTDAIEAMLADENCLIGLADGGAHYGLVCDASFPTSLLFDWVKDRGKLTIEQAVRKLSFDAADYIGLHDRGRIAEGLLADLNVIDMDAVFLHPPVVVRDLPLNGRRLVQQSEGYDCTIKSGVVTYRKGEHTGALPGRLVRNPPAVQAMAA